MNEFEKFWEEELNYHTKNYSMGPPGSITDTEVKKAEKKAAEKAWNAALLAAIKDVDEYNENWIISQLYTKEEMRYE